MKQTYSLLAYRIFFTLKQLLSAISFYRLRLLFSVSSIALGIGAIALIIGGIDGANKKVNEIFEMFGPDAILIVPGGERVTIRMRTQTLTWKDVNDIKENIPGIYEVIPMHFTRDIVKYKNKKWSTFIVGTTPLYFSSWQWYPADGVIFSKNDVAQKRAVCLIGAKIKEELFPDENPLGKFILVKKLPLKVIGVMEARGGAIGRKHIDDRIILPITTLMRRILNEDRYIAALRLRTHLDLEQTKENIRMLLRHNHKLGASAKDDFSLFTSAEVRKILQVISGSLVLFLGSAGIIALIVGGFILANLAYLSIKQRIKEIGIRRAYGATQKDIALLFLLEIIFTTILGGVGGMGVTLIGGIVLEKFGEIPMVFSAKIWLVALGLSLGVGIAFGLRPALNAARINPIEAIRG